MQHHKDHRKRKQLKTNKQKKKTDNAHLLVTSAFVVLLVYLEDPPYKTPSLHTKLSHLDVVVEIGTRRSLLILLSDVPLGAARRC